MRISILYTCCALLCILGCGKEQQYLAENNHMPIALVAGDTITLGQFKLRAEELEYSNINLADSVRRHEVLNILVNEALMAQYAADSGICQSEWVKKRLRTTINEFLADAAVKRYVYFPLISDEDVKSLYDLLSVRVRVSHILITWDELMRAKMDIMMNPRGRTKRDAEHLIDSLANVLLLIPDKFDQLVEEFSDDKDTKFLGGDLGYLQLGLLEESFRDAATGLDPGQISKPIETSKGLHVIKLVDRVTQPHSRSLSESRDVLKHNLVRRTASKYPGQVKTRLNRFVDSLYRAHNFRINEKNLTFFLSKYKKLTNPELITTLFNAEERKLKLALMSHDFIDIDDLIEAMRVNQGVVVLDKARMREGLKKAGRIHVLAQWAKEHELTLNDWQNFLIERRRKQICQDYAFKLRVEDKVNLGDQTLKEYYEERKTNYRLSDSTSFVQIVTPDSVLYEKYTSQLRGKKSFDEIYAAAKAVETNICKIYSWTANDKIGPVISFLNSIEEGDVTSVDLKNGNKALLKLTGRKPGAIKTFDQTMPALGEDYVRERKGSLVRDWLLPLYSRYRVVLYKDRLGRVYELTRR